MKQETIIKYYDDMGFETIDSDKVKNITIKEFLTKQEIKEQHPDLYYQYFPNEYRGLIPFTWEDVKVGDRLYLPKSWFHKSKVYNKWKELDKKFLALNVAFGDYRVTHSSFVKELGPKIYIDRRTFWQRLWDKLFC